MPKTIPAITLLATLAGCLPAPAGPRPGAIPTGEQLRIVDDLKTWKTEYEKEVGKRVYKDENGNVVGSSSQIVVGEETHSKKIWYPVQGAQQINDEDLFKITNDEASLTATRDMHERGRTYAVVGTVGMVVGIAAMIAGKFVGDGGSLSIGLYSGGAIVGAAGGYGFYYGWELQSPDTHAVDRSIANTDARNYNSGLGRGASLTLLHNHF